MVEASLTGSAWLDFCSLVASGFGGPILFWIPASTELLAAAVGRQGSLPCSMIGIACALGQCTIMSILYFFGERISRSIACLRKGVAAMPRRHLEKGKLAMTFGASLAGVPPTVPLFTLASSMCLRLRTMLMIFFPIRTVRFTACGIIGSRSHGVSLSELSLAPMALLHLVSHRVEAAPYQSAPPPFLARNVTNVHLQSV